MNKIATTSTTSTLAQPSLTADPAVSYAIRRYHSEIEFKARVPTLPAALPAGDKAAITNRLADVRKALRGLAGLTEREAVGAALSAMFAGFPNAKGLDPHSTIATYIAKLSDLPAWAIVAACTDVEHGAVAGMSPDYPPSASRMYQIAESKVAELRIEKRKIETVLSARPADVPARTPEEIERIATKMKVFAEDRAAKEQPDPAMRARQQAENERQTAERIKRNDADIQREYRAHGLEPVMFNGRPVSLRLAHSMGATLYKIGKAPPPKCESTPEENDDAETTKDHQSDEPEQRADRGVG